MSSPLAPLAMLATSMHAQPGVYALLLGSGVSTGAGVPTGWGVVTELVRRLAAVEDPNSVDDAGNDPDKWWRERHGGTLGYSSLLEAVAPTPAARQGLLANFFEPSDEEREEGITPRDPVELPGSVPQLPRTTSSPEFPHLHQDTEQRSP